jgi:hypothetical protein
VFLFKDPQPAMLPVIAGESAECVTELSKPVGYCTERPLVFSLEQYIDTLKRQASAWGIGLREVYRYPTISAVEKIAKSACDDFAASELRAALKTRSLDPLKSDIILYESVCRSSQASSGLSSFVTCDTSTLSMRLPSISTISKRK